MIGVVGMLDGATQTLKIVRAPTGEEAWGFSEPFLLAAAGLLVASVAMLSHGILFAWVKRLRVEMETASLQLLNQLVRPSSTISALPGSPLILPE